MAHEISQFDIADRQMLFHNTQSKPVTLIDIGQAIITRTIFGEAKVRVIRKQDRVRRLWLLTTLLATSVAASSWHWWVASQESPRIPPAPIPLSQTIKVSAPTFQPEYIPPADTPRLARSTTKTPAEILLSNLNTRREPRPQQSSDLQIPAITTPKPIITPPLPTNSPAAALPTTNNRAPKLPIDGQSPPTAQTSFQQPMLSSPLQTSLPSLEASPAQAIKTISSDETVSTEPSIMNTASKPLPVNTAPPPASYSMQPTPGTPP